MPPRLKSLVVSIVLLCFVSLGANGVLTWQWLSEREALRQIVGRQTDQLSKVQSSNRRLTRENINYQSEVAEKEQELSSKIAELAKKQEELTTLTQQLEAKQKEVTAKQKELSDAQKQIDDQKSQLSANATELAKLRTRPPLFSFQNKSSSLQDIETKKESVKQVVTSAYDEIERLYGQAYLLHSVTISFVESFSNDKASGEIVISNSDKGLSLEIRIKDFNRDSFNDVNTIIHEVVHSFHGLAVLDPAPFEEGIAVAVTDAVMANLMAAGSIPKFSSLYIQLSDSEFAAKQASLSIPRNTSSFYGSDNVADYYQVLGKAWHNLYKADNQFFKKFNEKLYAKKANGEQVTEQMVLDTIREVAPNANLTGAAWQLK